MEAFGQASTEAVELGELTEGAARDRWPKQADLTVPTNDPDWLDDVRLRLKRNNQMLFAQDSPLLEDVRDLVATLDRRAVTLWAFDLAAETVADLARIYPDDPRPREALDAARAWAAGKIKMPQAKQKFLACHAFAKELTNKADIARCHAVGQACSVVHTVGHALGYPLYDLTAIVRECESKADVHVAATCENRPGEQTAADRREINGRTAPSSEPRSDNWIALVQARTETYLERLLYWKDHLGDYEGTWADFMMK